MFRGAAAPNAFDAPIAKATDENLTSEDWGAIIEVCDKVSSDPNGPNQAVQSLIKRLAHRNANVQLYTLELANALSQNCGKNVHRELSSRAFTDALLKLANDRNTHQQVKAKILERMKEWSDMFSNDADLGIMYDAYYRMKQSNPTLQAPSAPQKNNLTEIDRQKEEDELQIALKLSLQEEERKKKIADTAAAAASSSAGPSTNAGGSAGQQAATPIPSHPTGTTAATVSRVRALYDFVPSEPGELEFKKGDVIAVLESVFKDWWRGSLKGNTGIFPLNYVEKLTDPTPDELQREAQMEAEVFAEIKNVEKLLTLLSTSNTAPREEDNEEISVPIRPKLIKLIEKYSQKKDDFTQLNEKFIKARRDYEALLETATGVQGGLALDTHLKGPLKRNRSHNDIILQRRKGRPHKATSPPPSFQRPTPGPAPFYLQGAEIPAQGGAPPNQQQQQFPPRDQPSRLAMAGNQPTPLQTTSPPPLSYPAYAQPPPLHINMRPQSTYGNPQELATSAYDSPIGAPQPGGAPSEPYSASVYSQDDLYAPDQGAPSAPPPAQTSVPAALALGGGGQQPQYTAYNPRTNQQPDAAAAAVPSYDIAAAVAPVAPPQPTGSAPPIPQGVQPHSSSPSYGIGTSPPPPLQPSGPAYDARQSLPSQYIPGSGTTSQPLQPQQPQYKAYVPPTNEPSAPQDYYRQSAY
ncbi:ESCRT-0 subunit protein hse1 [Diatrype stigma]|uniref:Class E vacuolar protein-sorting machinery protein HSE1 n=1 Tax=Diatrype stigma TaxID=117547 RepID=A0AAN9UTF9_9PEZI